MSRITRLVQCAVAGAVVWAALGTSTATAQDKATIARGEKLFMEQGCYGCHTLGKVGTPIALDLSQIGAKRDRAYLRTWLRDPASQRPTAHMPKIQMKAAEADALAAYLSTLK